MRVTTSDIIGRKKASSSNDIFEKCRNFTRPSDLQSAGLYMYFEVFGDREGLTFIPPHLIENILNEAEITHIHDEWTKAKLLTGKYKSSELYPSPADPVLKREYEAYLKQKLAEKKAR